MSETNRQQSRGPQWKKQTAVLDTKTKVDVNDRAHICAYIGEGLVCDPTVVYSLFILVGA